MTVLLKGQCHEICVDFFIKKLLLVPLELPQDDFDFYWKLAKILEFEILSFLLIQAKIDTKSFCYDSPFKGTVSWDFWLLIFFIKKPLLVPLEVPWDDFIFAEDSQRYWTKSGLSCVWYTEEWWLRGVSYTEEWGLGSVSYTME